MAHIICYHKKKYNIYSTIIDKFLFSKSLSLVELEEHIKETQGTDGVSCLPARLKRAHTKGTSCVLSEDLEEALSCNHIDADGKALPLKDCIEKFLS